jgi:hypothetical protein
LGADLEKLFKLTKQGYRITNIELRLNQNKEPYYFSKIMLKKRNKTKTMISTEDNFFFYVSHLQSIPHIEDDGSDFIYIDRPGDFFGFQAFVTDIFTGKINELIIKDQNLVLNYPKHWKKILAYQKEWILSEKQLRLFPTKLSRIFYDIGVIMINDSATEFKLIEKEKIDLNDIAAILEKSKKYDCSVCFSAFLLAPKPMADKNKDYDVIVGLITYDLKNNKTLSFNLHTIAQYIRKNQEIKTNGLWECIFDIFTRTTKSHSFKSLLPLPLSIRDFTPLPWFSFTFLNETQKDITNDGFTFNLPLFLIFGLPLLQFNKPSYIFKQKEQTAFIMLGFKDGTQFAFHQLRFDVSSGGPQLHLDYQIFSEDMKTRKKIVSHQVVNYEDIWNFSKNLAIGFLAASAYDIHFDKMIIPEKLNGLKESFSKNPLTVYPLFIRSMASQPYKWLKKNPLAFEILEKIIKKLKLTPKEAELIPKFEEMHLLKEGRLTIMGDIVYIRLKQSD